MHDFFIGPYETRLAPTEVMTGIQIPVAAGEWRSAYVKFQVHERPMLGLALALETTDNGETFSRDVIDDQQGSAEYKRHLIQVFLRRAFARALGA